MSGLLENFAGRNPSLWLAAAAPGALALFGCSDGGGDKDTTTSDGCALELCAPEPDKGLQLALDSTVAAGEEKTLCQFHVFDEAYQFAAMEHRYSDVSHHLVVYPTLWTAESLRSEAGLELGQVADCASVDKKLGGLLYAAQAPSGKVAYPEQVAYPAAQGQVVLVEYHVLNTTQTETDAKVRLNLYLAAGEPAYQAGFLFFYNYGFMLPPHQQTSVKMRCRLPVDLTLMAASSHMHARGIAQRSSLLDDAGTVTNLFDTTEWSEPQLATFDPPIEARDNQVVEFSCDYDNTTDEPILEGPKTTDEMCMSPISYYLPAGAAQPDFATRMCFAEGMGGPVRSGDRPCMDALACLGTFHEQVRPVYAAQDAAGEPRVAPRELLLQLAECRAQISPTASPAVHDLLAPAVAGAGGCRAVNCLGTAAAPGPCFNAQDLPECAACLQEKCAPQLAACEAAQ